MCGPVCHEINVEWVMTDLTNEHNSMVLQLLNDHITYCGLAWCRTSRDPCSIARSRIKLHIDRTYHWFFSLTIRVVTKKMQNNRSMQNIGLLLSVQTNYPRKKNAGTNQAKIKFKKKKGKKTRRNKHNASRSGIFVFQTAQEHWTFVLLFGYRESWAKSFRSS